MKKIFLIIFFTILFTPFNYTNAQFQSPIDGVTISNSPEKPGSGDDVTVTLESYLIDLNSSSIVWLLDNKEISKGIGIKKVKVKAPIAGKKSQISAIINTSDGRNIRKAIIIKSGSVEIIWETVKAYAPPFFHGKNQFIYENFIKFTAMPHLSTDGIKEIDPKTLVYRWKLGGKDIPNGTGYGIQSIEIHSGEIPKPLDISVEVYNRNQSESANSFIKLEPTEPIASFYEISPLYGILFNKALVNSVDLNNSEITILASPFGFNYNPNNSKLSYLWSINNIEQENLQKNQSITLRSKGDVEGVSNISVDIRNENDILERAISEIQVNFKKKSENNNENIAF